MGGRLSKVFGAEKPWERVVPETWHPERGRGLTPQTRDANRGRRRQATDAARAVTNERSFLQRYPEAARVKLDLGR